MMILFRLRCVSTHTIQYNRHIYTVGNCLFVCFSVTLVKPEKPLKVPEVEKFYKLPDSRAVVEFRINTGFTASCFFGTLLVAFAQIKDSYISVRCSATIVSIWPVFGNISIQQPFFTSYPLSCNITRSLARLVGLQEIYTIESTP